MCFTQLMTYPARTLCIISIKLVQTLHKSWWIGILVKRHWFSLLWRTPCVIWWYHPYGLAVRGKVGTLAARITGSQNELYACTPPLQPPHPLCFTPPVFLIHCQRGGCHVTDDCPIQMQISVLSVGSKFKWHPSNYLVTQLTRMWCLCFSTLSLT